jgi:hypothetical protein
MSLTLPFAFLSPCAAQRGTATERCERRQARGETRLRAAHRLVEPEQDAAVARPVGRGPQHEPALVPLFDVVAALPHVCGANA